MRRGAPEADILSAAYAAENDFDAAVQWIEQAIQLDPNVFEGSRDNMLADYREGKPYIHTLSATASETPDSTGK